MGRASETQLEVGENLTLAVSESDDYRRQILTSTVNPRTVRIQIYVYWP